MIPLSTHLRYSGRIAAWGLAAGTLALVAGCATVTPSATETKPITARAELILAADQTQQVNSLAASISAQITGDAVTETATGGLVAQLKPTLLLEDSLNMSISGTPLHITEILSGQTLYLKLPAELGLTSKPWVKIPFSQIPGQTGSALSQLAQNAQNDNPAQQLRMLTGSKNVRAVGTQMIDGVRTTEYTGSLTSAAAQAALPPNERSVLAGLTGSIRFNVWLDAQHHARKLTATETDGGEQVHLTMNITALNQPVHIVLPRPRRVALLPAGSQSL
jgi:hypothetical protein